MGKNNKRYKMAQYNSECNHAKKKNVSFKSEIIHLPYILSIRKVYSFKKYEPYGRYKGFCFITYYLILNIYIIYYLYSFVSRTYFTRHLKISMLWVLNDEYLRILRSNSLVISGRLYKSLSLTIQSGQWSSSSAQILMKQVYSKSRLTVITRKLS